MNHKAFTLIELLVVVAIIGILAAVGVVAYNGYTTSAKRAAMKQMHSDVIKFMAVSIAKCNIENTVILQGGATLSCNSLSEKSIIDAMVKHFGPTGLNYRNVLDKSQNAVVRCQGIDGAVNLCSTTLEPNVSQISCFPNSSSTHNIKVKSNSIYAVTYAGPGPVCMTLFKQIDF